MFHGGFGLLNFVGLPKPTFHAYRFLSKMGEYFISKGNNYLATMDENAKLRMIIYNFPEEYTKAIPISPYPKRDLIDEIERIGNDKQFKIVIKSDKPIEKLRIEMIDKEHGNALYEWEKMGFKEYLSKEEVRTLREKLLQGKTYYVNIDKSQTLVLTLPRWAIVLIEEVRAL